MKVLIYARISEADDRLGVERQLKLCRDRAAREGFEVVGEFVDNNVSAFKPGRARKDGRTNRAGYEALLDALPSADAVLVYHADRLFRQDKERLRYFNLATAVKVPLVLAVDGQDVDLRTADGRKQFRDLGSTAEYFSDRKGEQQRAKNEQLREGGFWTGGGRPFAFDLVQADGGKTLQVRTDEADALRVAYGSILGGRSLRGAARDLDAAGLRTARGNDWNSNTLRQTLIAERNVGPVVDRRTFDRVRDILTDADRQQFRSRGGRYLLSGGLVRCGVDGAPLVGRPSGGRRRYICRHGGRVHLGIDAQALENYVGDLSTLMLAPGFVVRDPATVSAPLLAALDAIEARITDWNRQAALAGLPAAEIVAGRKPLADERASLEAELEELVTVPAPTPILWKTDETGTHTDEWRAMIEARIDRIDVQPVGRGHGGPAGIPVADRTTIIWREGVRARKITA